MKKNLLAFSALALTVMSSSVLAASGDTIGSGSGNVNITGTVTTSTCAMSVTGVDQKFNVTKDQISAAKAGDLVATADATFTLNNCKSTPLQVSMKGTPADGTDLFNAFDKEVGVRYQLNARNTTDGRWTYYQGNPVTETDAVFSNTKAQAQSIVFIPASDADSFVVRTNVLRNSKQIPASLPSEIKAMYAYNITYK